jgi:hypothetical protein
VAESLDRRESTSVDFPILCVEEQPQIRSSVAPTYPVRTDILSLVNRKTLIGVS